MSELALDLLILLNVFAALGVLTLPALIAHAETEEVARLVLSLGWGVSLAVMTVFTYGETQGGIVSLYSFVAFIVWAVLSASVSRWISRRRTRPRQSQARQVS